MRGIGRLVEGETPHNVRKNDPVAGSFSDDHNDEIPVTVEERVRNREFRRIEKGISPLEKQSTALGRRTAVESTLHTEPVLLCLDGLEWVAGVGGSDDGKCVAVPERGGRLVVRMSRV